MNSVRFLLNMEEVVLRDVDPNMTVLQYLRENRQKKGTKEGCASGDCGACTVVIAEISLTDNRQLFYKSVNACITFIASLHGKQLITVEDLKQDAIVSTEQSTVQSTGNEVQLHPVQQSMVDNNASQCGFCTPGFVMSSFALHKNSINPNREQVMEALAGNLCRCTGYRSIIDAAMESSESNEEDVFVRNTQKTIAILDTINQQDSAQLVANGREYHAPKSLKNLAEYLLKNPNAHLIAGGTDIALSVTQNLLRLEQMVYLGDVAELNTIEQDDAVIQIGAAVPYSRFTPILEAEYPELGTMIKRIGSTQIRNSGTLGGNIGNASPIGDMPPALIALGAKLILHKGDAERVINVEDYFVGYKQTILGKSEFIKSISIPKKCVDQHLKVYKISKRIDDDISAVLAAININVEKNIIKDVSIVFGGMAAIPKRATQCEAVLLDSEFTEQTIRDAQLALARDFQPMSDVRASDRYRMKVAQNVLFKCFLELKDSDTKISVVDYA